MKLCTVCGVVTSRPGSRCTTHARQSNRSRHNALYSTREWQHLSARVLRAWRGLHGNWCPGYLRGAHAARDLTVDHVVPLAAGGALLDITNCAVLCRSCNSTKGASEPDRGDPHAGSTLLEDRADAPAWIADAARSPRTAGDRLEVADAIPDGQRNATLASLAGTMRRRGMTAAEIEAALLTVNAGRCQPPLPDDAVRGIATSVGRYPPGDGRTTPPRPGDDSHDDGDPAATDDPEREPGSEPGDPGPTEPAAGGKRSQATMILDLAADVEFFHTADDVAYARIERDGHHEVWPLGSKSLRAWLSRRFHQAYGRAAGGQALRDALNVLMGRALFEGPEYPVFVRVAGDGSDIYLDLGDPLWQAVRITATGWEIIAGPPVRFRRPKGLLRLPAPVRGGTVDQLRRFVNVRDDDGDSQWRLFIGCLVAAFRPHGPYPILALNGEHGSAKSTRRISTVGSSTPTRASPVPRRVTNATWRLRRPTVPSSPLTTSRPSRTG